MVGEEAAQALSETECNWLSFEEGDVPEIFNAVQQVFDFYNQIDSELYDAVMQEQDIQSFWTFAVVFLIIRASCRFVVEAHRPLQRADDDIHDESWMEMLSTGYASVTVIDALKKPIARRTQPRTRSHVGKFGRIHPSLHVSKYFCS